MVRQLAGWETVTTIGSRKRNRELGAYGIDLDLCNLCTRWPPSRSLRAERLNDVNVRRTGGRQPGRDDRGDQQH